MKWHRLPGVHAVVCPIRSRWRRRRYGQPFWRADKTAALLGVGQFGCPRCGRGAIKERDLQRPAPDAVPSGEAADDAPTKEA